MLILQVNFKYIIFNSKKKVKLAKFEEDNH
jgi:hypothetical protein